MSNSSASSLYEKVKKNYYSVISYDYDLPVILKFFTQYSRKPQKECRVLDVGCGYGKKLRALQEAGYTVLGVDVNSEIVEDNQKSGLPCVTTADFLQQTEQFDMMLMSHIIEHFNPPDLKNFMDAYLDKLKSGGYLIIATPLLTNSFYDDFDHIKPYSPLAIMMVFGRNAVQVQYYSRNKLDLVDLQFRKRHHRFNFVRDKYLRSSTTKLYQILEFTSIFLCLISFGFFGKKDGWIGVFKKI